MGPRDQLSLIDLLSPAVAMVRVLASRNDGRVVGGLGKWSLVNYTCS